MIKLSTRYPKIAEGNFDLNFDCKIIPNGQSNTRHCHHSAVEKNHSAFERYSKSSLWLWAIVILIPLMTY
jgi:glutamine synthetase